MPNRERLEVFTELTKLLCGVGAPLSESNQQWFVPVVKEIGAKQTETISVYPQMLFKPRRLFVFEPEIELQKSRPVSVRRGGWRIHSLLVGTRLLLPAYASFSGDMFAGDAQFDFDGVTCDPALAVSLSVENTRSHAAPFCACIIGKYLPEWAAAAAK